MKIIRLRLNLLHIMQNVNKFIPLLLISKTETSVISITNFTRIGKKKLLVIKKARQQVNMVIVVIIVKKIDIEE